MTSRYSLWEDKVFKKMLLIMAVFLAGLLMVQEISYALIPGVGAAVRRVRKNAQENQKSEEAKK